MNFTALQLVLTCFLFNKRIASRDFKKSGNQPGVPLPMSKKYSVAKPAKKEERRLRPEDLDEIDEFAAQRERVGLESESEIDSDDYENFDEDAILNVPDSDDYDLEDDEDEDQDFSEEEKPSKKDRLASIKSKNDAKSKKERARISQLAKDNFDSDEDILYDGLHREATDDEDNAAAVWGKNRKNYYAENETAEAVEEEAEEAKRLQKKKLAALSFDDFVGEDAELLHRSSKSASAASNKKKISFDDLQEFEPTEEELGESEEAIKEEEMADFLELLKDFKERLNTIRTQLVPLMQRAREGSLPSSSGLSFLQLKYHLMLGYCTSVVYYLMLKGRGGRIEGHPVIKRMIRFRLMLEKIRPLEAKMKYQIESLLQPQEDDETDLRANIDDMVLDSGASEDEEQDASGVYRAPKLAPVYYPEDDKEASKQKRHEERRQKTLSKSRLLAELRGELEDLPEEEPIDPVRMSSRLANDEKAKEREAYEEENFMRFTVSKKEKRRLEQAAKPLDELEDLDDFFGELEEINEVASGRAKKGRKAESIAAYLDQINSGKDMEMEEDDDEPQKPSKYTGSDESDIEDDSPKQSRKEKKYQKRQEKLAMAREARGPVSYRSVTDMDGDSKVRPASYNIIKNRGLTPSRSKEQRNPRVKQRTRYEKAIKKHASARGGKLSTDTSRPYGGESTGIRTNLAKSVRFN